MQNNSVTHNRKRLLSRWCWLMGGLLIGLMGLSACVSMPHDTVMAVQARVEQVNGRVLLVRDNIYFEVEPDMDLQLGDRLLSLADASATVQYYQVDETDQVVAELCQIRLAAREEWSVQGREDCDR